MLDIEEFAVIISAKFASGSIGEHNLDFSEKFIVLTRALAARTGFAALLAAFLVGCNGSDSSGTGPVPVPSAQATSSGLTGPINAQSVRTITTDFDTVTSVNEAYYALDFLDGLPVEASAAGACPAITNNVTDANPDPAILKVEYKFGGCTPDTLGEPVGGAVSLSQQILKEDSQGNALEFLQDYTYSNLLFDGVRMNGRLKVLAQQTYGSGTEALTSRETYDFSAFKIEASTYNGREIVDLQENGNYRALLNMNITNAPGNAAGAAPHALQVKSDFAFNSTNDAQNSSVLSGTATATSSALGTYAADLKSLRFNDACDGTAGGTFTIRGANGDAVIKYGPACNRTCVSINGSSESCS